MAWTSKTHERRRVVLRSMLQDELALLDAVTVNDQVPDLLKDAAPDTYDLIQQYLRRRLAALS